ncbi:winged helix-turn-helix transcriptional regulator [Butyricimonas paravirosa]|uniref:winged helix-turn-helix transcriptional regulator n=1 Tax=Butyricimonas paravirosa TaxID=1472417 RepID=UPI00210E79A5|nr:winged helix-turn-helix transcriptional regulator [Butyricimonas paravirosa]MCQ4875069.1 winged helix-turn-helix transcriptional regulator [Butyricimonas paravirosa]
MYRKNTLRKALEQILKKHPENIQKTSTTQQQIIDAIKANPTITRRELIYLLNSTEGSIKHHLSQLTKKGIIKREGSDRTGRWVVNEYPQ